jgi:tripartite-type tricarboxylate transporter receptor subunit TctC
MRRKFLYLAILAISAASSASAQSVADYYEGRTVTILVGSGPGGTTDISGRVIAEHLQRHVPGNPRIIVQNLPGGGSVTMTNYLYRSAPRDGSVLGYSLPGIITAQMMEPRRARFDGRKLNWIGSALKYTGVISVMSTAPATTIEAGLPCSSVSCNGAGTA